MKKVLLFILLFSVISCEEKIELDGNWVVLEIIHNKKSIYPKTVSDKIRLVVNVTGYEGAEKIVFKTIDSTVTFPGFNSNELKTVFEISENKILFGINKRAEANDAKNDITKDVFYQEFNLITSPRKENLNLISDKTTIKLINENYLFDQRINNLLY